MTSVQGAPYSPLTKGRTLKRIQTDFTDTRRTTKLAAGRGKKRWLAAPKVVMAWIFVFIFTAQAQSPRSAGFRMPPSDNNFVNADVHSVGTLKLKAKGLLPNTAFRVFLAADFLGEVAANTDGRGSMRARTLVEADWFRMNLHSAVLRFTSPSTDDLCFTPEYSDVERSTSQSNVHARRSASATTTLITSTRSTYSGGSIFHTINWRFIPCVSTF